MSKKSNSQSAPSNVNRLPAYTAFQVQNHDGKESGGHWTPIGAAWEHADQKGLTIVLKCLPIDGKLVLRQENQTK